MRHGRTGRAQRQRDTGGRHARRTTAGFTLIELLAVMAIILMLSGIVVGSYVGMSRGTASVSALNHLHNTLTLARQRACMDGARTYVWVTNETTYVVVRAAGIVTKKDGQHVYDEYTDLSNFGSYRYGDDSDDPGSYGYLYNVTCGTSSRLAGVSVNRQNGIAVGWRFDLLYSSDLSKWTVGDRYGWEVYPARHLPKGFKFDVDESSIPYAAYFNADGSSGGIVGTTLKTSGAQIFTIYQEIYKDDTSKDLQVQVSLPAGAISIKKGMM